MRIDPLKRRPPVAVLCERHQMTYDAQPAVTDRRHSGEGGFTMVEIALCLAIVGFALVAIIGVLPTGMNVQRDNRYQTIINQDAAVWMDAIRSGAQGYDDLTNYVVSITVSNYGEPVGTVDVYAKADLTNGAKIVGLLTLPKYMPNHIQPVTTNFISAVVRAISGGAVEKPPQNDPDVQDMSFTYRLVVENTPLAMFTPNPTNVPALNAVQWDNSRELRLLFRWPYVPTGIGNGRQAYRMVVGGTKIFGNPTNNTDWLKFMNPSTYTLRQ